MKLNSILFLQKGHQYLLKNAYVENAHKIDHVMIEKTDFFLNGFSKFQNSIHECRIL